MTAGLPEVRCPWEGSDDGPESACAGLADVALAWRGPGLFLCLLCGPCAAPRLLREPGSWLSCPASEVDEAWLAAAEVLRS